MPYREDPDLPRLLRIRDVIGPIYGSEDISMLLYTLIRREKPKRVVELGTGLGVSTVWMAKAMKDNGAGSILTFDDGRDSDEAFRVIRRAQEHLPAELRPSSGTSFAEYLQTLFRYCGVADHVTHRSLTLAPGTDDLLPPDANVGGNIDLLFSDFAHGPDQVMDILACFLPLMSECSSIFIDSASTHLMSFLVLERVIGQLNDGKIPNRFLAVESRERRWSLFQCVTQRTFRLMHLIERRDRSQNSTTWIRIEPTDWVPHPVTLLH